MLTMSLVASCSKVERVSESTLHELVLSPLLSPTLKSESDDLQDGTVFGVFSYLSDMVGQTDWKTAFPNSTSYMENAAFKFSDGIAQGWNPDLDSSHPYYWPMAGSLMFAGYSPYVSLSNGTIRNVTFIPRTVAGVDSNPYMTVEFTQNVNPVEMVDLLWFDVSGVNSGLTVSKREEPVDIVFKHALAKVEFNISYEHFHGVTARLTECIFTATFFSGRTPGWLPSSEADLVTLEFLTAPSSVDSEGHLVRTIDSSLYMIPQFTDGTFESMDAQIGGDIMLELIIIGRIPRVETTDDPDDYIETRYEIEIPIKDYTPRWEMGKRYVYNVTIEPKAIEFAEPTIDIREQVFNL